MKETDALTLRTNLERSLTTLTKEISDTPPQGLDAVLKQALQTLVVLPSGDKHLFTPLPSLESIKLHAGPSHATSTKIRNALLRPMDWIDIGWKAAGLGAAVPTFGAWTAVGFVLVMRDLLQLFSVKLSLVQGHILHVLAEAQSKGEGSLAISTLCERANEVFGTHYDDKQMECCLKELARLKCVAVQPDENAVMLIEEVRL
jgi:hypothetical protein